MTPVGVIFVIKRIFESVVGGPREDRGWRGNFEVGGKQGQEAKKVVSGLEGSGFGN